MTLLPIAKAAAFTKLIEGGAFSGRADWTGLAKVAEETGARGDVVKSLVKSVWKVILCSSQSINGL